MIILRVLIIYIQNFILHMPPLLPAFGGHQDEDNLIFNVFLLVQSRVLDEHMFFVTPAKDLSTKDAHETTPTESYAAGSLGFFCAL